MDRTLFPAEALREFVDRYMLRSEHLGTQVLVRPITASSDVLLVFNLDQPSEAFEYRTGRTRVMPTAFVVGPQTGRSAELVTRGDSANLAVRFQPAGFHRLFHGSVERLVDTAVDACDAIGPDVGRLCDQLSLEPTPERRVALIESFLLARVPMAQPRHPAAEAAAAILAAHGSLRVSDVIRDSGLSERRFERAFREQMGTSPKRFARAVRLNFALGLKRVNPTLTWTRVSQEAGYFDQTHFVKEFKALAGETPSTFPLVARNVSLPAARRLA